MLRELKGLFYLIWPMFFESQGGLRAAAAAAVVRGRRCAVNAMAIFSRRQLADLITVMFPFCPPAPAEL